MRRNGTLLHKLFHLARRTWDLPRRSFRETRIQGEGIWDSAVEEVSEGGEGDWGREVGLERVEVE